MMKSRQRIVIIHPEGNIAYNSNLQGILELLVEQGFVIDYCYEQAEWLQPFLYKNVRAYAKERGTFLDVVRGMRRTEEHFLIIGVDRGIIPAREIAEYFDVPYGYISYEIFFADETSDEYKRPEIEACRNVSFVVVQDEIRGLLLQRENHIAEDKMIYIPIGYRGCASRKRSTYLHDHLGIPYTKKIALMMGGVHALNGINQILASISQCPDDWCLVLHDRYGKKIDPSEYDSSSWPGRVYQSDMQFTDTRDANQILASVDVGLAFYCLLFTSKYNGKNVQYLGMASGKIALYFQYGVPVITNVSKPLDAMISERALGIVVEDIPSFWSALEKNNWGAFSENCTHFFKEVINLDKTIEPLLLHIKNLSHSSCSA